MGEYPKAPPLSHMNHHLMNLYVLQEERDRLGEVCHECKRVVWRISCGYNTF